VSCDDGNGCFKSGGRIDVQQFIVELDVFQPIVQSLQVLVVLLGTASSATRRSGRRHQANPVVAVVAAVLLILFRGQQRKVVGYALGPFHCAGCFVLLFGAANSVERERGRRMMTLTKHPLSLRGWWKEEEIIFLCCMMMTSRAPEIIRIKVDDTVDLVVRCC